MGDWQFVCEREGGGVGSFLTDRLECLSSDFFTFAFQCSYMFLNCSSHTSGKNEVKAENCDLARVQQTAGG